MAVVDGPMAVEGLQPPRSPHCLLVSPFGAAGFELVRQQDDAAGVGLVAEVSSRAAEMLRLGAVSSGVWSWSVARRW